MMKKKKDLADEKPVDQQIAELQRKFRVLENDKRAYSEDSQGIIRKQRATIEKLTRENRKMKAELNETREPGASGPAMRMGLDQLQKLGDMHSSLQDKLEEQTDLAKDLKEKVETAQRRVQQGRHEQGAHGGVNASLENSKAVGKQIRILENRLDQALQKFNQAIAMNRKLREEIDTLRGERMVFDDIYRKLENELQMKKKEMAFIIEQANAAYEARDSAQAQMAALKQQADKEHAEFEKEWRELGRLIENDKKMKEFMRQKVKSAAESGGESPKGEDKARKKITQNAWQTSGSLVRISAHQEKVSSYEEAFAKIQAATGIDDIDVLVSTFVSAEDQNYSLFKYNNELSADIEKLETTIGEHKEEHVTLSGTSNRKEDTEHAKLLETLEEKWRDVDKKALHYELKCTETQQAVNQIRQSIQAIFLRIGCTPDDLPAGAGSGISDQNMMMYLGVIEQKTNELTKLHDQWKADEDDDGVDAHKSRPPGGSNLQIKLPSTVEDYSDNEDDDEDDDQRPFTRDELKTKTTRAISRKQKKKGKGGQQADKS